MVKEVCMLLDELADKKGYLCPFCKQLVPLKSVKTSALHKFKRGKDRKVEITEPKICEVCLHDNLANGEEWYIKECGEKYNLVRIFLVKPLERLVERINNE